jgi:hypothetical protein
MWTDVQDLWGYFVNACEEILEAPVASFFWPDAPIPVRFERDGPRRLTVTVDNRKVSVDRVRFVAELCEAGAEVFDQLAAITSRREYQLEQAQRARAIAQRAKSQSSS